MENIYTIQTVSSLLTIAGMPILIRIAFQVGRLLERFDHVEKRVAKLENR